MNVLRWILYFIPALVVEVFCYLTNPIAALFTYRERRFDTVKRLGSIKATLPRDYLWLSLWQTHDNAADEWWYGVYNEAHWFRFAQNWTQGDYDNSWWIRYYCRLMWLYRNNAYGWLYAIFSRPKETALNTRVYGTEYQGFWLQLKTYPSSFQFEFQVPLGARYLSVNIGWKAHKSTERLLYANRIIGFRKYK